MIYTYLYPKLWSWKVDSFNWTWGDQLLRHTRGARNIVRHPPVILTKKNMVKLQCFWIIKALENIFWYIKIAEGASFLHVFFKGKPYFYSRQPDRAWRLQGTGNPSMFFLVFSSFRIKITYQLPQIYVYALTSHKTDGGSTAASPAQHGSHGQRCHRTRGCRSRTITSCIIVLHCSTNFYDCCHDYQMLCSLGSLYWLFNISDPKSKIQDCTKFDSHSCHSS